MLNIAKINGKMTLTFDITAYSNLLSQYIPQAIETEAEYDRVLKIVERLSFAKDRTPEEKVLHKLLVTLIEAYETANYPMNLRRTKFFSILWNLVVLVKLI